LQYGQSLLDGILLDVALLDFLTATGGFIGSGYDADNVVTTLDQGAE
jgi:hypothetical protein